MRSRCVDSNALLYTNLLTSVLQTGAYRWTRVVMLSALAVLLTGPPFLQLDRQLSTYIPTLLGRRLTLDHLALCELFDSSERLALGIRLHLGPVRAECHPPCLGGALASLQR